MEELADKKKALTLSDQARIVFKWVLNPIAAFFNRLGIMPNTMTILGLLGNAIGAFFLMQGDFLLGGLIILVMGLVDALDGTMARLRGESSDFGAFVDSVTDRYSELVIFCGLLIYYVRQVDWLAIALVYLSAAGSILVSYVRARAQSVGIETKVGLLTRLERYLVLAPALLLNVPLVGIGIIAVLGVFTALQRIWHVRVQARRR
jgi:CDP-diacylglycerol--glycerol-3-phosphate 3-phosphatidyltransferase